MPFCVIVLCDTYISNTELCLDLTARALFRIQLLMYKCLHTWEEICADLSVRMQDFSGERRAVRGVYRDSRAQLSYSAANPDLCKSANY